VDPSVLRPDQLVKSILLTLLDIKMWNKNLTVSYMLGSNKTNFYSVNEIS